MCNKVAVKEAKVLDFAIDLFMYLLVNDNW